MRRRPYGPRAWLIDELEDPIGWAAVLAEAALPGVEAIIPSERAVTVRTARHHHDALGPMLEAVEGLATRSPVAEPLTIDVVYDGADLPELAEATGLSTVEIVRLHSVGQYSVAFCGFSPGFGYLRGLDERLHVPRRPSPRTAVPAGSVGLAAGYTCVYPSASPGGWHLIGHTTRELWNVDDDPPALMQPGRAVRFRQA